MTFHYFSDDDWSDDFDAGIDDNAVVQKIEYQSDEPALYIPFMKAITAITEQPKMLEHFNFYPIGNSAMISLAMDTLIQAAFLLVGMVVIINLLLWTLFRSASAVVLPQLAIGLSILFVIGGLSWLNLASTTLIALTVMLIIAVGVADCVHVMSSYLFFRKDGKDHDEALSKAYGKTGVPILLTTITTMQECHHWLQLECQCLSSLDSHLQQVSFLLSYTQYIYCLYCLIIGTHFKLKR